MTDLRLVIGNRNYSSWSMRVGLVAARSGLELEEVVIPFSSAEEEALRAKHSPSGLVPVLWEDGVAVWESLAICERLHELAPEARLWPEDPVERALARSAAGEMHAGFGALRRHMPFNVRRLTPGDGGGPGVQADIDRICALWRELREAHGAGGDFLFGAWCIADSFFTPVASRFRTYGVELPRALAAYAEALLATPEATAWIAGAEAEPWTVAKYEV